ncbi:hypothetical protein [Roseinatronobacter sp. S2]|uniref:hypothetical protein n=1 Tax=Roseinatronobacter sp. S2 TaxID=3035471 RepID=UPI00240FC808|nr:hypothetical protein [Roseinatronobacter sp. S2]WFE75757.1 hypothetical protein P8S53_04935 [Roseinatronobacter sp. S2]
MSQELVKVMNDLYGNISFGGGGGGGGNGGGGRNVNHAEKAACAALGAVAGGATATVVGGATKSPNTGLAAGGAVGYATYEACVGSLSTSASYDGMMTAP